MEAEYMALIDGLELCTSMGLSELDVESDSQVLVMAIGIKDTSSWKHIHVLRRCLAIIGGILLRQNIYFGWLT